MNTRMRRFTHGALVRSNRHSPYRCAPPGSYGTVARIGREVIYVNFPAAAELPMDPFEIDSTTPR